MGWMEIIIVHIEMIFGHDPMTVKSQKVSKLKVVAIKINEYIKNLIFGRLYYITII
jgi:hypothetical protein